MLVSFSVSNFRSFREEQTFSLVASKRFAEDHPEHTVAIPGTDERVLRFGVLYGANGAGKSNLLKALQFLRQLVVGQEVPVRDPFRFGEVVSEPTVFDLRFIAGGKLYDFGLAIGDSGIVEEWLFEGEGESETALYERSNDEVSVSAGQDVSLHHLAKVGVRPDRTFLGTVSQTSGSRILAAASRWLAELGFVLPSQTLSSVQVIDLKFLKSAGADIDGVRVVHKDSSACPNGDAGSFAVETLQHETSLPLDEESDGTRRLFNLASIICRLEDEHATYLIDEIERSLHPLLVRKVLAEFLRSPGHSQLIVTTHDSNLLDLELLRRDEVWFAEKDAQGATHLYSLSDFKPREGSVQKHYLQGRFGAIPFLGGTERLFEQEPSAQ